MSDPNNQSYREKSIEAYQTDSGSESESKHLETLFNPGPPDNCEVLPEQATEWAFSGTGPEARHIHKERCRQLDDSDLRVQFAQADLDTRQDHVLRHQQAVERRRVRFENREFKQVEEELDPYVSLTEAELDEAFMTDREDRGRQRQGAAAPTAPPLEGEPRNIILMSEESVRR